MRILVLDDDHALLKAVKMMLSLFDHDVDTTPDPKGAIKMVEEGNYDFVLVDYKMPENDGIWFMKNVTLPKTTKALLITAYVNRDVINKMFELGACGYIIKPFTHEDLTRHLNFFSK